MIRAWRDGLVRVLRSPGLVALAYLAQLGVALIFAVPLSGRLEGALSGTSSAAHMMYGFDYSWWSRWSEQQHGWTGTLGPDLLGAGFAARNLDLLLHGGLFSIGADQPGAPGWPLLGMCAVAGLIQVFLLGGILALLRRERGSWHGLLHGAGFHFGRLLRLALLALAVQYLAWRAWGPFGAWADAQARQAVSETSALVWLGASRGALLALVLGVHMVASLAKVILVLDDRRSAVLSTLAAAWFCARHPVRTAGQYACVVATGVALLAAFVAFDGLWTVSGFRSQLVWLAAAQALVFGWVGLRLSVYAGQMSVYRAVRSTPARVD